MSGPIMKDTTAARQPETRHNHTLICVPLKWRYHGAVNLARVRLPHALLTGEVLARNLRRS